jgi:ribosomal protein L13E
LSAESKAKRKGTAKRVESGAKAVAKDVEKDIDKAEKAVVDEARKVGKTPRTVLVKPTGRPPEAMVMSRHGTGMISRVGKGFSLGELSGADVEPRLASNWGAKIDHRRRSVLEGNVASLKGWRAHAGTAAALKKDVKVVGEKAEEAVKEVEKGVGAVEKEAAKAGRKAKKEAKKAEVAVKEKVEKPRSRPKKKEKKA